MSSDINFTVTSRFLGNVSVKPYFNTQCPPTVLPNGVKVAVSDQSQKCQKLTKVGLACSLQLNWMYFI